MNNGIFGEGFPYTNFHDLNMDWIIKIAKDFLDQYTHIQEIITTGLEDLGDKTEEGIEELNEHYTNLNNLLQQWYNTHSEDIANQLADALNDLNAWYTLHENYLDQTLINKITEFNNAADEKAAATIASIPADYTALSNFVDDLYSAFGNSYLTEINAKEIGTNANFPAIMFDDTRYVIEVTDVASGNTYGDIRIVYNDGTYGLVAENVSETGLYVITPQKNAFAIRTARMNLRVFEAPTNRENRIENNIGDIILAEINAKSETSVKNYPILIPRGLNYKIEVTDINSSVVSRGDIKVVYDDGTLGTIAENVDIIATYNLSPQKNVVAIRTALMNLKITETVEGKFNNIEEKIGNIVLTEIEAVNSGINNNYPVIMFKDSTYLIKVIEVQQNTSTYGDIKVIFEDGTMGVIAENVSALRSYVYTPTKKVLAVRTARMNLTITESVADKAKELNEKIENTASKAVVTVGTGKDYATIQAAVNAITDNSKLKKYVILVDEGTYDITDAGIDYIPLKPYVKIQGVDKAKCIISFRPSTKDSSKNVFQNASSGFLEGESEVCEFTLVTENVKGALHLDDASWKGTVYFHDIIHKEVSDADTFTPSDDYYMRMDASVGSINLATHIGQTIIIENVTTNGYIYSHTLPASSSDDLTITDGGTFIVRNCICTYLLCSANGDMVRKNCIFEGNKCTFLKISFNDTTGNEFFAWNVELKNNDADFIAGIYLPHGSSDYYSLWTEFFGCVPFSDPNLHRMVQNNTQNTIQAKTKVNFTDATKRYITPAIGDTYDAITMESITPGWYGIVQDGGNLDHYWSYLQTHEASN